MANLVTANYPNGIQTFDPNAPTLVPVGLNPITQQLVTQDNTPVPGDGDGVTSITRNGLGQVTAWVSTTGDNGSATYNANGTVATVTEYGVTRTVSYNPDGTVASYL